ncbi:amidase signature enzyme [Lipomyces doorenjongii]|uniref:amidase signature enzyme n=1 Tax=Lipomyces doorenjongii TaxID=383834 RepID=UPI0034CE52B0
MSVVRLPEKISFTREQLQKTANVFSVNVPEKDVEAYRILLSGLEEAAKTIAGEEDYVPQLDLIRFPRKLVHKPETNEYNAWAYKVTIKSTSDADARGLLAGKTVAIKDNICIGKVPSLLGTDVIPEGGFVPQYDATVVTRVLTAGATILGKGACENFSMSPTSFTNAYGFVQNPFAAGYNAGGSSSGCAALVAGGLVDMAVGGDQGGSIRVPASYCGLVGLKPTYGLVPYTGIASLAAIVDHTGPMTKTVMDNALMLMAMAGADGYDDRQIGLPTPIPCYLDELTKFKGDPKQAAKGFRIGLIMESFDMPGLDPRVIAKVKEAAKALQTLGVGISVEEISVPMHAKAPAIWTIATRQGFSEHGLCGQNPVRFGVHDTALNISLSKWDQEKFDKLASRNPAGTNALLGGQFIKDSYPGLTDKAINLGRKLKDEYNAVLEKYDVLITPCTPSPANYTSKLEDDIMTKMSKAIGTTINTAPFNISGNPAMSLPIAMMSPHEDESLNLPVGMQIVGKSFGELDIYKVAYAWEQSFDWKSF